MHHRRSSTWRFVGVTLLLAALLAGCGATGGTGRALTDGAAGAIGAAAFGPGGALLATANPDATIAVWETASGARRFVLAGHAGEVTALAFSADGALLASGGGDRRVELWDLATGKELRALAGHTGGVDAVAFSPDGRTVASGGQDGSVRVWDVASGAQRQEFGGATGGVTSLAFSPNGQTLASGGRDATIRLRDLGTGQLTRSLTGHKDAIGALAFSPDGKNLTSGGADRQVKLWSAADGRELQNLAGHGGAVGALAFAPDGQSFASGSDDRSVKIWGIGSDQARRTLTGHTAAVPAVAFGPDGKTLLSGSRDNSARQWEPTTGQLQRSFPTAPPGPRPGAPASGAPAATPIATRAAGPPGTIVPNGPAVSIAISAPGQPVRLTFAGTAGRRISVAVAQLTIPEGDLTLLSPDGTTLGGLYLFQPEQFLDAIVLPTTGTYSLTIAGRNGATGGATLTAYEFDDTTGTIALGGPPVAVNATVPGQNARLTFAGTKGQRVSAVLAGITAAEADLTLLASDGTTVAGLYLFQREGFFDAVALPANDTYTFLFSPRAALVGGATLTAYDVRDEQGTIAPGGPAVAVRTTVPGQNARLAFAGTAGQRISVGVDSLTIAEGDLVLIGPDGATVQSLYLFNRENFFDAVALPASGGYTLVFDPRGPLVGGATLTMYNVADRQGQIAIGGPPVAVTLDTPGQRALLTFSARAGQRITVTVDALAVREADIVILGPDGARARDRYIFQAGQTLDVTLPTGGTYTLVFDPRDAAVGSATIGVR